MKNNKLIFITILLLTIGFAAVSTSLIINGNISFNTNEDDFDVYFSSAEVDNEDYTNEIISEDKQSITYETKNLSFIGDTSVLEYEVTNASKNYDAEVKVTCTSVSEEITLTHTPETQVISATNIGDGKVEIKLNKTVVDEKMLTFTCTLNVNAVERESLGENEIANTDTYVIEGNYVDESGSAIANANLVIFSGTPHYVTTDENGYLFYNGLERGSHEIYHVEDTLENIKAMTKDEIISNAKTSAEFKTSTKDIIMFNNHATIKKLNIKGEIKYCESLINNEWKYLYTGEEQLFIANCNGTYKIELWGAQGGSYYSEYLGGAGAYTSGNINLDKNTRLYVTVGKEGHFITSSENAVGAFNGGGGTIGAPSGRAYYNIAGSGGGATDIKLINGIYQIHPTSNSLVANYESLKSRIMVAAGGGGSSYGNLDGWKASGVGGAGGALIGIAGTSTYFPSGTSKGGTQTAGGNGYIYTANHASTYVNAGFGYGGGQGWAPWGGGGGGYYGGGSGGGFTGGGAGGSSFISGHNGCDAIDESSTSSNIIHTGQANHYSGYVFTDTVMKAGNEIMPSHDGTSTMTGNSGNGYAKITLISLD